MSLAFWTGEEGKEYHERNPHTVAELEALYRGCYGVGRLALNHEFLGEVDREMSILEVGAGCGVQLSALRSMGFKNLYGIEPNDHARELARLYHRPPIRKGDGFSIPYGAKLFDLVYTSGVLIHIRPDDLPAVMKEMERVSRRFIWGFEYFGTKKEEVEYHGHPSKMFVANFAEEWTRCLGPEWRLVKERFVPHAEICKRDASMYLFQRTA